MILTYRTKRKWKDNEKSLLSMRNYLSKPYNSERPDALCTWERIPSSWANGYSFDKESVEHIEICI